MIFPSIFDKHSVMNRKRTYLFVLLLSALVFVSYLPVLKSGFVNYDDNIMLTGNKAVRALSPGRIAAMFSKPHAGLYHPLVTLSYAVEYRLAGLNPRLYHATNLLLHTANAVLVFVMIFLMTSNPYVALAVAVLFGVHPMHVESVAWVSARKDTLYAFFFLLSLICYQLFRKKNGYKWYMLSLAVFLLSLLSKPMAVTLPVIIVLLDYYEGRRYDARYIYEKLPYVALSAVFSAVAVIVHKAAGWTGETTAGSLIAGMYRALNGLLFYVSKLFAPTGLTHTYVNSEKFSQWFGPADLLIIMSAVSVFVLLAVRKISRKTALFGAAFFVAALLPVLQIVANGRAIAADRYTYIPSIGIFFVVSSALYAFSKKSAAVKKAVIWLFILLAAVLSVMTWQRCLVWRDSVSLWSDVLAKYPGFAYALNNRGLAYCDLGEMDKAFDDFQNAIKYDPGLAHAYNNRANLYRREGDIKKAFADYDKSLELNPSYLEAYFNRGSLHEGMRRYDKAVSDYSKVIELDKGNARAYLNRGNTFAAMKEYERALGDYSEAIWNNPSGPDAYINRASVYIELGELEKAAEDLDGAVRASPLSAEAYYNRGVLYAGTRKSELALFDFGRAIELDPGMAKAYYNRGMLYRFAGNRRDAERDLNKAKELGIER